MASLDDFQTTQEVSLDDLYTQQESSPVVNKASNTNLAVLTSALNGGEDIVDNYRLIQSEMNEEGKSTVAQSLMDTAKQESAGAAREALQEFLLSPDYDDATKQRVSQEFLDVTNERFNVRNIVAERSLIEDAGSENVEQEVTRISLAGAISEVNAAKRLDQSLLNSEVAKNNTETVRAFMDIAQYLTPFVESTIGATILKDYRQAVENGEDATGPAVDAMFLAGSAKAEIIEGLKKLPPYERSEFKRGLAEIVKTASKISLTDENDFAKTEFLNTFVNEEYTEGDKWIDNAISLLDMTVLGGPLTRLAKKAVKRTPPLEGEFIPRGPTEPTGGPSQSFRTFDHETDAVDTRRFIKSEVQPTTLSQVFKDTNPKKAKDTHDAAFKEGSGEFAEAVYGTNKTDAIANDLSPEIKRKDGVYDNKVGNIGAKYDQEITPAPEVLEFVKRDGAIQFTEAEKRIARSHVFNDFENALGLTLRHEMSQLGTAPQGASISAVYGPSTGGFGSASEALEHTAYALRDYGITSKDLKVLVKTPSGYIESTFLPPNALEGGDYLVKVDYNYKVRPNDVTAFDEFSVKYNLFDRFETTLAAPRIGTVQRMLLDPASMLDPRMSTSANSVVDRAAGLERLLLDKGEEFAEQFKSISKERQQVLSDYIKEANHRNIPFNANTLASQGWTADEVQAIRSWRKAWDSIYWLENKDAATTLRNRGYKLLQDVKGNTRLIARPIGLNQIGAGVQAYDPVLDAVRTVDSTQLKQLYGDGGTAAKLRTPEEIDGTVVEFVVTPNKANTSYFRDINEYDQVLNYRHGYYQVNYTAPRFVVERVKDKNGKVLYEKAVAVAGNIKDAQLEAKRLASVSGKRYDDKDLDSDIYTRGDIKGQVDRRDDNFDLQHAAGRSSQRIRGKRLRDATAPNNVGSDHSYIMGPAESLIHSSRNISRRVMMRDWLEASKARFLQQYKAFLPTDEFGRPAFPNKVSDMTKPGRSTDKDIADARTTWEYIRYMEDGYINGIDNAYKAALNSIGDLLGNMGMKRGERSARFLGESRGPLAFSKNVAFHAYLVGHPLRQLVIQAHQAIMLTPNFTQYVVTGKMFQESYATLMVSSGLVEAPVMAKILGMDVKKLNELVKDLELSGMLAAIDKQNLVRSGLSSMSDSLYNLPVAKQASQLLTISRKIGFDLGESMNIISSFLAHRDDFIRKGGVMTDDARDKIAGQARNYTYNMNAAGDMPYNQNFLSLLFQFFQVPHKVMTQLMFNRILSPTDKMRLTAFIGVMFTLPTAAMYDWLGDVLPEDPETRDMVVQGLHGYSLNKALEVVTGEKTRIDFSGLAPLDAYGLLEFTTALWTTDAGTLLSESPSGQLFFGHNPRLTNSAMSLARYFNWIDDTKEPTEFMDVVKTSASIFSGMSSYFKASYIMEAGKKMSTTGAVIGDAGSPEAIAALFGFPTMKEVEQAYIKGQMYKDKKKLREDVTEYYTKLKQQLAVKDISVQDKEFLTRALSSAWLVFESNERDARNIVLELIERDVKAGDMSIYQQSLKQSGFKTNEEIRRELEIINNWDAGKKKAIIENLDELDKVTREE